MKKMRFISLVVALVLIISSLAACSKPASETKETKAETTAETKAETSAETKAEGETTASSGGALGIEGLKVGAITTLTKDDGGWCQAQYVGITDAMKNLGMSDDQLIFAEEIAEEGSDSKSMVEQLIADGCNIIIGASSGYKDMIASVAPDHPDILFMQFNGVVLDNAIGYAVRDYQSMFLMGYLAALKDLDIGGTGNLGYSAGQPEASVVRGINAFALGAKYANPDAKVTVQWANSWYDPAAETECAKTLIQSGVKVMGINASSPAIAQANGEAGTFCTGYHQDMKEYAPGAVLSSHIWNWGPIFTDAFQKFADTGKPEGSYMLYGQDKGCPTIAPINMDIVSQEIADKVLDLQEKIKSGEFECLAGEIKDNEGNVIVPEGEVMSDEKMMDMGMLVENVNGKLP